MIDLNDRFIGLMIALSILIVFFGYLAFFGKVEEEKKHKAKNPR